jgi:hypothetical protein
MIVVVSLCVETKRSQVMYHYYRICDNCLAIDHSVALCVLIVLTNNNTQTTLAMRLMATMKCSFLYVLTIE